MIVDLSSREVDSTKLTGVVLRRIQSALDSSRVLEAMAHSHAHKIFGATAIEDCCVDRVHFGSGLGYVVDYTLQVRRGGAPFSIKAFGQVPTGDPTATFQAARSKLRSRLDAVGSSHPPAIALLETIGVILRAVGTDERIEPLPGMVTNASPADWFGTFGEGELEKSWSKAHLLSHRLGKRAVLRLSGASYGRGEPVTAILKLYKRKSTAAAHCAAISAAIERQSGGSGTLVAIPRVFRLLGSTPGLLMEDVAVLPLHDSEGPDRTAGHRSAGEVLARFHSSRICDLEPYGIADEIGLLRRWLAFATSVRPVLFAGLAPRIDRLAREAARCEPFSSVPIHRDFHDKQVMVAGKRSTLIDFDTVRSGDPAQDVGNFMAHVQLRSLQVPGQHSQSSDRDAFIDGYRSTAPSPSAINIDWHRRASLLRLAFICGFSDTNAHLTGTLESCT